MRTMGMRMIVVAAAVGTVTATAQGATYQWANTGTGAWMTAGNWTPAGGPPLVTDTSVVINNGGTATISDGDAAVTGTSLTIGTTSGGVGYLAITGGSLSVTGAATGSSTGMLIGHVVNGTGTVTQTGGTLSFAAATINKFFIGNNGTGTYNLQGGTLDFTNVTEFAIARGAQTAGAGTGRLIQTGGTLTTTNNARVFQLYPAGTGAGGSYEISGGTLDLPTGAGTNGYNINMGNGTTFRVKGSAATIKLGSFRELNALGNSNFEYVLDNSAGHISPITSTFTSYDLFGNLKVSLAGGVLLTGDRTFDLVQAGGFDAAAGKSDYAVKPLAATSLWNTTKTSTKVSIELANQRGSLDMNGGASASFAAASYGFVELANVNTSQPLVVSLDLTGGSTSNFTTALTNAGITWVAGSGIYDVKLTLNPATAGGTAFAWDLSTIDPAMGGQAVAISTVPEPGSVALMMLSLSSFSLVGRRRP